LEEFNFIGPLVQKLESRREVTILRRVVGVNFVNGWKPHEARFTDHKIKEEGRR